MGGAHHVSGQVTRSILAAAEADDWPYRVDLAGVTELEAMRSTGAWVSWEGYLGLLRGLVGGAEAPEVFERCGMLTMEHGARDGLRGLGGVVGGVKPMYDAVFGWVMGTLLPEVEMRLTDVGRGRLRVEVRVDPSLPPSEPFFHTLVGSMTALPSTLGRPYSSVQAEVESHRAVYDVTLPTSGTVWARLRRASRALFDQASYDEAFAVIQDEVRELLNERRAVNLRLSESEAQWQSLAEGIPGVVLVVRPGGGLRGPFGAQVPEPAVTEAILDGFRAPEVQRAVVDGGEVAVFDVAGGSGNEAFAWSCRASRLPGGSGEAVVVALDDSERKRAQAELLEREQRLLQSQKMEALGRLAGGVAHDLNNLLAALQTHADLIDIGWGTDPKMEVHVEGIGHVVERAGALTRRLLGYARGRAARLETIDLADAVRSDADLYARLVGDAISVVTDIGDEAQHVRIDPSQLPQVLMNLVANARDAMPDGGVITLRTRVEVDDGGDWVVLEVSDEGFGMDDEVLRRAMEPFFTTKQAGSGTGLGLSTVYWAVEQAGGEVRIESRPGAGSTVQVRLPRVPPAPVSEPEEAPASLDGRPLSVLLVEDEPSVRQLTTEILERLGHEVRACADAGEARRLLDEVGEAPDLLLTDITMPGESGVSLANDLAARFDELGIVLMSGFTTEAPELEAPHRDRGHFVPKPFTRDALCRVIAAATEATRRDG